jgi:hypothetical protein
MSERPSRHTFRCARDAQAPCQPSDGANNGYGVVARNKLTHERSVDLDLVERETAQKAQRRIAVAEIIHRNSDSEVAKPVQDFKCRLAVFEEYGFGDLKLQSLGRKSTLGQRRHNRRHEFAIPELSGRQVHRDRELARPMCGVLTGSAKHPVPQRNDQAGFLGKRDELARQDDPA